LFNITLEIHVKTCTNFFSECFFNFTAWTEVKEVINKEAKKEWRFAFDDDAGEDAWCVGACFKTE